MFLALEVAMAQSDELYGTYRCPVCGHRDGAVMQPDEEYRLIRCTYCDTSLEVWPRGLDSVRFSVQVAEEPAA
jgi:DNA-directed RNA polymerase subunit RPC12/RpoP